MYWKKLSHVEINDRVEAALKKNINYRESPLLGVPGSYLDEEEFYPDAPFLEDSPFLATLIANPNHIGCHTYTGDKGEPFFQGTQQLEVEVIRTCAEQILGGEENGQDGYIAPGGTEANIEAMWIYRNFFIKEYGAKVNEIALVYSEDSHYSMPKGANILNIQSIILDVEEFSREIIQEDLEAKIEFARNNGVKHFILIQNMATTMFGSVDDIERVTNYFVENKLDFKLHIDAAFGGFIYPFTARNEKYSFKNEHISSVTLDGHKMLQTPYGTGIFIARKGLMEYVETEEAKYVHGKDYTICGSRSGANAVTVWMTLMIHGSNGWTVKMEHLLDKTSRVCSKLDKMNVKYFRCPDVNIITIRSECISDKLAKKYHLIPDNSDGDTKWWKIVVMQHVKQGFLDAFVADLKAERTVNK